MKYAFISDIHGNAVALEAVLKDIKKKKVDKIVVLGDLCFRGPSPKKSLDLVRAINAEVIKGNADEWVIRGVQKGEVADTALDLMNHEREWTLSHLEENDDIEYLKDLPHSLKIEAEGTTINAFHATPNSLFEIVSPTAENETIYEKMMTEDAQVFVYGHIHTPYIRYIKGKIIINTGSVGLPFDGLTKASYALVDVDSGDLSTSIERVSFDIDQVISQYKEVQYPNFEMMATILTNGGPK